MTIKLDFESKKGNTESEKGWVFAGDAYKSHLHPAGWKVLRVTVIIRNNECMTEFLH